VVGGRLRARGSGVEQPQGIALVPGEQGLHDAPKRTVESFHGPLAAQRIGDREVRCQLRERGTNVAEQAPRFAQRKGADQERGSFVGRG
jgi:hypothetical protein